MFPVRRTDSWNLDDVLDFEWMLARDRNAGDEELQKRDYTVRTRIASPESPEDRRATSMRHGPRRGWT